MASPPPCPGSTARSTSIGGNVAALLERAVTYGDMGRMTDMLADAREVHRLTGGHPTAYYLQAVLAARARNFELARRPVEPHPRRLRRHAGRPLLLSAIDFETGNEEQAARRLAGLVADQPGNRRARRLLAAAQWRMGDAAGAIATLRPIADLPDADSYSLSLMGRALARLGDGASRLALSRPRRPAAARRAGRARSARARASSPPCAAPPSETRATARPRSG